MDRWTMRELEETDDITFAIQILYERRRGLTPYSPLGMKLSEAAHTLSEIKAERDRYLERISALRTTAEAADERETDAEVLEEMQHKPCEPTSPERDDDELGGADDGE